MGWIRKIGYFGTSASQAPWLNRNIIITNYIAMITALVVGLLTIIYILVFSFDPTVWVLAMLPLWLLTVPYINRLGYIDQARYLLCFYTIAGTLAVTIARKFFSESIPYVESFYLSRAAILIFSIVPFAVFELREKFKLLSATSLGIIGLFAFDPLHNLFDVGYFQVGYNSQTYYYNNLAFLCFYLFLTGIIFFFKKTMEDYQIKNEEHMAAQMARNKLIEDQKEELESQGFMLQQLIDKKDRDLAKVAEELLLFNHHLLHYSYALSHNLRGPLASLLGLINLLKRAGTSHEREKLMELTERASEKLDGIIHDMNRIVEERTDTFHVMENVSLEEVLQEVLILLKLPLDQFRVRLSTDFHKVPVIYSSRQRVHYILFCLISNAIQYRKPGIPPEIKLTSGHFSGYYRLDVEDKGSGIDLVRYGEELFKPFKRFHTNSSGKGIGLYLAKLQVEKLQGTIEVQSTPQIGTVFRIYLRDLREGGAQSIW